MVIGHIHRTLGGGGTPREIDAVFSVLSGMGHQLVLFTHEPEGEQDFKISTPYRRVVIGDVGNSDPSTPERTARLRAAIEETGCELVVHHLFFTKCLIDDLALFREMGVPALVKWHSCFGALNMFKTWDGQVLEHIESIVRLSRGVITLSQTDKAFFELMGVPAVHIPHSLPDLFEQVPCHGEGHRLLWVGRFVQGKHPLQAVQILERVLERFPDATLTLLGDGFRRKEIEAYISEHPELAAHVSMPGFVNDVTPYLREADVYLVTSSFEGFMLSLLEAKMAALPTVGYRMDYLDTTRPGTGYCAVPQRDVAAAASEVCRILADPEERHRLGAAARKDFEAFLRLDQKALYQEAFDMALHPQNPRRGGSDVSASGILRLLLEQVDAHSFDCRAEFNALEKRLGLVCDKLQASRNKVNQLKEQKQRLADKAQRQIHRLKNKAQRQIRRLEDKVHRQKVQVRRLKRSYAYRIGRLLTWPVRKLKGLFLV